MKFFEKIGNIDIKNLDTLDLELELQNPIGSSDIDKIKEELKSRYGVMGYYKKKFPHLDISFDWSK